MPPKSRKFATFVQQELAVSFQKLKHFSVDGNGHSHRFWEDADEEGRPQRHGFHEASMTQAIAQLRARGCAVPRDWRREWNMDPSLALRDE